MNRAQDIVDYFRKLDRSFFLENGMKMLAGQDTALPIGYGQTISQPSLVCEMVVLLEPHSRSRILEIGTGSGYQTAFLAEFGSHVYSIERIGPLLEKAKIRLAKLGYHNISYKEGDGSEGWKEHAPYDRVIVSAAASRIPDTLVEQMAAGGRMVIPVGPRHCQKLLVVTKDATGQTSIETTNHVVFVEFKGKYGWED